VITTENCFKRIIDTRSSSSSSSGGGGGGGGVDSIEYFGCRCNIYDDDDDDERGKLKKYKCSSSTERQK